MLFPLQINAYCRWEHFFFINLSIQRRSFLNHKFLQYTFFQHHFKRQFRAIRVKFGIENFIPNNHTMAFDTKSGHIRLYQRDMKMIRNSRIMAMDLIIVCKETIKYTWNILIVNSVHEHSGYICIHFRYIKNSELFIQGVQKMRFPAQAAGQLPPSFVPSVLTTRPWPVRQNTDWHQPGINSHDLGIFPTG